MATPSIDLRGPVGSDTATGRVGAGYFASVRAPFMMPE